MPRYDCGCSQSLVSQTHTHTHARQKTNRPAHECARAHWRDSGPQNGRPGSCLSSTQQSSLGSRLDPVCLNTVPPPRSLFLGVAALSSWLSWSSLCVCADFKPSAVSSCQEFIILNTRPLFPTVNKRKGGLSFDKHHFRCVRTEMAAPGIR